MKKISKLLYVLAAASLALVSCQQEVEPYSPGDPEADGCYGVYFPAQEASGSHTYDPTAEKSITIQVARTNSKGAITVPYEFTSNVEGIFNVGQINFADGQSETTVDVKFPNISIGENSSFSMTITDNQYASKYAEGAISFDCSILCVEWQPILNPKTGKPAVLTLSSEWRGISREGTGKYFEVNGKRTVVLTCTEEDGDGFFEGYPEDITFYWYPEIKGAWDNGEDDTLQAVDVPKNYFGFDYNDGNWLPVPENEAHDPIYLFDWYSYFFATGQYSKTAEEFYKGYNASYPRSYYDGNGAFYLNLQYFILTLGGGWTGNTYDVEVLIDGYTRTDYSVETESDYSVNGVLPYYLELGKDVAKVKYAAYEGSLTPTQVANKVAAISDGTEEVMGEIIPTDADFDEETGKYYIAEGLVLPATGAYTLVAVSFSAQDAAQKSSSVEAYFVSKQDVDDNEVKVSVTTEDTPSRYTDYDAYTSFAYYVCGEDLTDVHLAIIKAADYSEDVLDEIKADKKGKYAVSEEVLASINGAGGYYTVQNGLEPDTQYVVVVWATNGALDKIVGDTYKTEAKYNWNSLGKGTITDDLCSLYKFPPITVPCDVWEEATTPGLYKISGFQLALTSEIFGEDMTPYEGGNWKNTSIIIDATDPEAVSIAPQDYGVCLNSADGFMQIASYVDSDVVSVGTLADGSITFPVKGLLIGLSDGWYYGNKNGAFEVALPSSASANKQEAPAKASYNGKISFSGEFALPRVTKFEREPKAVEVKTVSVPARERNNNRSQMISGKGCDLR